MVTDETAMDVKVIRPGLWRWTAPHPAWVPGKDRPGGWWRMVGCLYYEPPEAHPRATVLIDPLAPPAGSADADRFWRRLDADVARRGAPVAILLANQDHERSSGEMLSRYGASPEAAVWAPAAAVPSLRCEVAHPYSGESSLPGGVTAYPVEGLYDSETILHIPAHGALVAADSLLGTAPGRLQVPPIGWAPETPEGADRYRRRLRASLRRLLDLSFDMVLVSHGEPVLTSGREALETALSLPAWGD